LILLNISVRIIGMANLHPTQKKLLQLLEDHQEDPLTIRELQDRLNLSSTSLVAHHIQQLEKRGWIKRDPYNPQNYTLLRSPEKGIAFLNLYGLAQCGPDGSLLSGDPVDRIPVSTKLLDFPATEAFMVKARGSSMRPLINEGDLIVARKTNQVPEGRIVVCVNDGVAMIKRFQRSGDIVLLVSENSAEFPAIVAKDDFRIEGEVRRVSSIVR